MWGMTKKDLLRPYVWIFLGVAFINTAVGVHLATKKKPPEPGKPATIEGELQLPIFTTFTRPDRNETTNAVIVVVITPKSLKKFVWLQGREAYELKYDAVAARGGRARVTYTPNTVFEDIPFDGTVLDIVPVK